MSKQNNIDFILPKQRTKGDALKLIMEIAVVLNWRQPSDDAIVQFLKQYPTLQTLHQFMGKQARSRSH